MGGRGRRRVRPARADDGSRRRAGGHRCRPGRHRAAPPHRRGGARAHAGDRGGLRRGGGAGHPRRRVGRALPHPLPPGTGPGRRAAAADPRRHRDPGPAQRGDRAVHAAARAGLRRARRPGDPRPGRGAVACDGLAVRRTSSTWSAACRRWSCTAGPGRSPGRSPRSPTATARRACARCGWRSPRRRCSSSSRRSRWPSSPWSSASASPRGPSSCTPPWWYCCSPRRPTGRCDAWARSSTPLPRGWPPSRRWRALDEGEQAGGKPVVDPAGPGPVETTDDLVVSGATVRYPGRRTPALDALDVRLPARGVTVLTGPSGCGKTTLLGAVAGLVPLEHGTVAPGRGATGRPRLAGTVRVAAPTARVRVREHPDNLRLAAPAADDGRLLRGVALGRARGAGAVAARRPGHRPRRGRAEPLGRRACPARPGAGAARRAPLGPARRADRPPRRAHRAGGPGHRRRPRPHPRGGGRRAPAGDPGASPTPW